MPIRIKDLPEGIILDAQNVFLIVREDRIKIECYTETGVDLMYIILEDGKLVVKNMKEMDAWHQRNRENGQTNP
jgi:hypothetical protein